MKGFGWVPKIWIGDKLIALSSRCTVIKLSYGSLEINSVNEELKHSYLAECLDRINNSSTNKEIQNIIYEIYDEGRY